MPPLFYPENPMKSKSAFTLIELLVVIAIIAILAAILFPVFAKAREKARQTTCASNLKELGIAFTQYEQDFDELTPTAGIATGGALPWDQNVWAYTKSTGLYACPDDPKAATSPQFKMSYGLNANLVQTNLSTIVAPTNLVLLYEDGTGLTDNPSAAAFTTGDYADVSSNAAAFSNRHDASSGNNANANYLAFDGHVKYVPYSRVSWTTGGVMTTGVGASAIQTVTPAGTLAFTNS